MKKILCMLAALLTMGAASVTMTSCSSKSITVEDAQQMFVGQWRMPQTFLDCLIEIDYIEKGKIDELYLQLDADGTMTAIIHVSSDAQGKLAPFAGKYAALSEDSGIFAKPDENDPSKGQFPFTFMGSTLYLDYRNLKSSSVEMNFFALEDGLDIFNGLGWQTLKKVSGIKIEVELS